MLSAEVYGGIEFVRISGLPLVYMDLIMKTLDHSKIIKILRGKELLNDCVQLSDYHAWASENNVAIPVSRIDESPVVAPGRVKILMG